MAAHLRGDRAAFRELVERYADGLLRYLVHMTANRDQAEDLFQETFKKVHEKAHTYRGPVFKSWLFTIATRATIDHLRRRKRSAMLSLDQEADCGQDSGSSLAETLASEDAPDPADELVREERKQQVREAVASLPVKQRAALVLAYYQQLSYREVADVMGCSLGTVKTQMSRALATLARRLPESIGVTK
ncbi:MAG: sigma-70 family RNA polymerase sigma factor [Sedimentisphaerales bacterium]|jgi:RNA polymerase sigma-70 factor (ECF subfamily)|nr:sigma-70 family RNA polymerase sigma factor [Sedimentisphaerales bacterium]HNY79747.1 sigma-70 family RNA polymerase sigma factor [Sedimentisphaerales bacterium]HOC64746.1 sigma-70 family RNA polymerase sigma factor [Sedimentisphaerales bacterium]HOH65736.1 sigma-70 family RNA polymerase sigma factor [Sedimentisphaerales bacterium]HPY51642.1 sigma-70 family RNA polymerase sigma factor [Sedimentisphaerales bacterium]